MKILFDTNVILDVLLKRQPHAQTAVQLFAAVEFGMLDGLIPATALTAIFYLARKATGHNHALAEIRNLLKLFAVAPVSRVIIEDALNLPFTDFEDAVLHEAGRHAGVDGIVTRNVADFKRASLHIYNPDALLRILKTLSSESQK